MQSKRTRTQGKILPHPKYLLAGWEMPLSTDGFLKKHSSGTLDRSVRQGETPTARTYLQGWALSRTELCLAACGGSTPWRSRWRNSSTTLTDYSNHSSILRNWVSNRVLALPAPSGSRIWYRRNLIDSQTWNQFLIIEVCEIYCLFSCRQLYIYSPGFIRSLTESSFSSWLET